MTRRADIDADPVSAPELDRPSQLEIRYRRLLRVLPAGYRAVREQEMVDAYLQQSVDADPDLADLTLRMGWPGLRESASVLALAVRVRWAGVSAPERARAREQAVRTSTLIALVVLASMAISQVLATLWFAAHHPAYDWAGPGVGSLSDLWSTAQAWSYLLWPLALAATLSRRPRQAQAAATIPLLTTVIGAAQSAVWSAGAATALCVQLAVVVGLSAFEPGVRVRYQGRWLIAGCAGISTLCAVTLTAAAFPAARRSVVWAIAGTPGLWCAATVIAAAVLLACRTCGGSASSGGLLAVSALAGVAAVLRGAEFADWARFFPANTIPSTVLRVAVSQQLIVAAIAVATGILGAVKYRQLPHEDYQHALG